jgi:hypothetical protein
VNSTQFTRREMITLCATSVAAATVLPGAGLATSDLSPALKAKCQDASTILADYLTKLVAESERTEGGVTFLMACATDAYSDIYPEDSLNPLLALPSLVNKEELTKSLAFITKSAVDLLRVPDRIALDGLPILYPGHMPHDPFDPGWDHVSPMTTKMPLDLPGAWVRLLSHYQEFGVEIPHKDRWARLIARSIDNCVPFANGLVYADPQDPPIGFGYQDSIRMSGLQLLSSLAIYRGLQRAAALFDGSIEPYYIKHWTRLADDIRANLYKLYDPKIGGYVGGTWLGHQFDVWGNGLAYPMADYSQKESIAGFYRANRDKIFLRGCTRQIAERGGWQGGVNPGYYQNGGFWGTGTGYVLPVLAEQDPALAIELIEELTANLEEIDFAEWLDPAGKPSGAQKFLGSVALPLMGINCILQNKPLIEYF